MEADRTCHVAVNCGRRGVPPGLPWGGFESKFQATDGAAGFIEPTGFRDQAPQ